MAMHVKNMKELNKALQPVMKGMVYKWHSGLIRDCMVD